MTHRIFACVSARVYQVGPYVPLGSLDNSHDRRRDLGEIAVAIVARDSTDSRSQTG